MATTIDHRKSGALVEVVVGWQIMGVGGECLIDKFLVRRKIIYEKWNHKPIFVISVFILLSIGKQFSVVQHFPLPQTPLNVKNIFPKINICWTKHSLEKNMASIHRAHLTPTFIEKHIWNNEIFVFLELRKIVRMEWSLVWSSICLSPFGKLHSHNSINN